MNELLIYKVAFDNIARTIKQWNNDEEAEQADFEYLMDIENTINAVGRLPDNATNGDVIKALFNETEYPKLIRLLMTSNSFWNAPYKGGQEE